MNRERAKELLPIIQAFAEGEEIEWKDSGSDDEWTNYEHAQEYTFSFEDKDCDFRIKPEPFECWMNIYPENKGGHPYPTEEEAAKTFFAGSIRIAHMKEVK